jgi:hypothetical protein
LKYIPITNPYDFSVPEPVIDEGCKMDRDCPSKQACIITNNKGDCKNPCTIFQPCVQNAECKVYDSLPLRTMTCTCFEGFTGKGDELCQKISKLTPVTIYTIIIRYRSQGKVN